MSLCGCETSTPSTGTPKITAKIVDYGVFRTALSRRDQTNVIPEREPRVLMHTDRVESGTGVQFGFTFEVHGLPESEKITLTQMVRRPAVRLNQLKQETIASTLQPFKAKGRSDRGIAIYQMGGAIGTLPGTYAIELWFRGRLLARKAFIVSPHANPKNRNNPVARVTLPHGAGCTRGLAFASNSDTSPRCFG